MKTTSAGLFLLLIGVIGLSAFVSGNLPQLLAYLFGPGRPASPTVAPAPTAPRPPAVLTMANRRTA